MVFVTFLGDVCSFLTYTRKAFFGGIRSQDGFPSSFEPYRKVLLLFVLFCLMVLKQSQE